MKALVASLLLFFQAGQVPDRWECREGGEPLSKEELVGVRLNELKPRPATMRLKAAERLGKMLYVRMAGQGG